MKTKNRIFQFKITLKEIAPVIWRRVQVPANYNFWDLHVAIQDSMGWLDYHLHQFTIKPPHANKPKVIGIPDDDSISEEPELLPGWETEITRYFTDIGVTASYIYDFGDGWEHEVILEGLLIREKGLKYPHCTGGKNACPPEDCGGVDGYFHFLESTMIPAHEEHKEMKEWVGGKFDPKNFNPDNVKFDNPKRRWKHAFMENK